MGRVICDKHGRQGGVLCCPHVAEASYGQTPKPRYKVIKLEIEGHKSDEILHHICESCLEKYNLTNTEYAQHDIWADENLFPYVYPVCAKCFK